MGLDTYIYKKLKKSLVEQAFNKLVDEEEELIEVFYWRKCYSLQEWFSGWFGGVGNCEYHEMGEEVFVALLYAMEEGLIEAEYGNFKKDIIKLKKFLKVTDFNNEIFYFWAWW